jgi:TatD DNase family protein
MNGFFDTHAHYDDERYDPDRDELLRRIHASGIEYIMNITAGVESLTDSVALAEKYDFIYSSCGLHPHEAKFFDEKVKARIIELCAHPKVRAIGEIGLDYFHDHSERDVQRRCFIELIDIAKQHRLPVIIHDRDAHMDCLNIIRSEDACRNGGVFHCYSGSVEMARDLLKLGFHISFTGNITFPKAHKIHEVAAYVPIERIMIETDCPYLTPEPHRGGRNDSSYLPLMARAVAGIKNMDYDETVRILFENSMRFYSITGGQTPAI